MSNGTRCFTDYRGFLGQATVLVILGFAAGTIAGCQCGGRETARLDSNGYAAAPALNQLVGKWNVEGSILTGTGERVACAGTATGTVDKEYFLRLEMQIRDPRNGQAVQGASLIGQDGGRLLTMASTYSSTPELRVYRGELDPDGKTITLTQITRSPSAERRLVLRFISSDQWTTEAWNSRDAQAASPPTETLAFHRIP